MLELCAELTEEVRLGSKIPPVQVANCAIKIAEQRFKRIGYRSHDELRAIVRLVLTSAETMRRSQNRSAPGARGPPINAEAQTGSPSGASAETATPVSAFELFRQKLNAFIFDTISTFLARSEEKGDADQFYHDGLFLVACVETCVFYTNAQPKSSDLDSKTADAFSQSNKKYTTMCARLLAHLTERVANACSLKIDRDWAREEVRIALHKAILSCFGVGETFIIPFINARGLKDNPLGTIVRSIAQTRPASSSTSVYGFVYHAAHAYISWAEKNQPLSEIEWSRLITMSFEADAVACGEKLLSSTGAAPCTVCALEHLAKRKETKEMSATLSQAVIRCLSSNTGSPARTQVSVALRTSNDAIRCIVGLQWQMKFCRMLWYALTDLTMLKCERPLREHGALLAFQFYEQHAQHNTMHAECARESVAARLPHAGAGIAADHPLDGMVLNGQPNWAFITSLGIQSWTLGCKNTERIADALLAFSVLASMELRDEWIRAMASLSPLIGAHFEETQSESKLLWRSSKMKPLCKCACAMLALWTCPAILKASSAAESAHVRFDMIVMGQRITRAVNRALTLQRRARLDLNITIPGKQERDLMEYFSQLCTFVKRAGCPHRDQEHVNRYCQFMDEMLAFQTIDGFNQTGQLSSGHNPSCGHYRAPFTGLMRADAELKVGRLDETFAREFIEKFEREFDARTLKTRSSTAVLERAVVRILKDEKQASAPLLCSAVRVCCRIFRDIVRDSPQHKDAERTLRQIFDNSNRLREESRDEVIEAALRCILGVPLAENEHWQWPLPPSIVAMALKMSRLGQAHSWGTVQMQILTSFWGTERPTPCLCAAYAIARENCIDDISRGLVGSHERAPARDDSPIRWASLVWRPLRGAESDAGFADAAVEEPKDTVPQRTLSKRRFFAMCKCTADSESLSRPPADLLLKQAPRDCVWPWLAEWARDSAASRNEGSVLVAFDMWRALQNGNALQVASEEHSRCILGALQKVLIQCVSRRSSGDNSVLRIQQSCIEPHSPFGRTLTLAWDTKLRIIRCMARHVTPELIHVLVESSLLSSLHGSEEQHSEIHKEAMHALLSDENELERSVDVLKRCIYTAYNSTQMRTQLSWLELTAQSLTRMNDDHPCRGDETSNRLHLAAFALFRNILTLCPTGASDATQPNSGWWVCSKTICSAAQCAKQMKDTKNEAFQLVKKQCEKTRKDPSSAIAWFNQTLRAYVAWTVLSVDFGRDTAAAARALRNASVALKREGAALAGQVSKGKRASAAWRSLVSFVVKDALTRPWCRRDNKNVKSALLTFLRNPITSSAAWKGWEMRLEEVNERARAPADRDVVSEAFRYLRCAIVGLLPGGRRLQQSFSLNYATISRVEHGRLRTLTRITQAIRSEISRKKSFGTRANDETSYAATVGAAWTLLDVASHPKWHDSTVCPVNDVMSIERMEFEAQSLWRILTSFHTKKESKLSHMTSTYTRGAELWAFSSMYKLSNFRPEYAWHAWCELYPNGTRSNLGASSSLILEQWSRWMLAGGALNRQAIIDDLLEAIEPRKGKAVASLCHPTIARSIAAICAGMALDGCPGRMQRTPPLPDATLLKVIRWCSPAAYGLHVTLNEIGRQVEKCLLRRAAWSDDPADEPRGVSVADVLHARCMACLRAEDYRMFFCESMGACITYLGTTYPDNTDPDNTYPDNTDPDNTDFRNALDAVLDGNVKESIIHLSRGIKIVRGSRIVSSALSTAMLRALADRGQGKDRDMVRLTLERFGWAGPTESKQLMEKRQALVIQRATSIIQQHISDLPDKNLAKQPPVALFVARNDISDLDADLRPLPEQRVLDYMYATCASVHLWAKQVYRPNRTVDWGSNAFAFLAHILKSLAVSLQRMSCGRLNQGGAPCFVSPRMSGAMRACARVARRLSDAVGSPARATHDMCKQLARDLVPPDLRHHLPHQPTECVSQHSSLARNFIDTRCVNLYANVARCALLIICDISRVCPKYTCGAGQCALVALKFYGGAYGSGLSYMHARHAAAIGSLADRDLVLPEDPYSCALQLQRRSLLVHDPSDMHQFISRRVEYISAGLPQSMRSVFASGFTGYWATLCFNDEDQATLTPDEVAHLADFVSTVTLDTATARCSTWDVSACSFLRVRLLWDCWRGLLVDEKAASAMFSNAAACLSWVSGAIGAARHMEPEHLAFSSPVPLAVIAVLGGSMFENQKDASLILDHHLGNDRTTSAVRQLARRAIFAAKRAIWAHLDLASNPPTTQRSLDDAFFEKMDDVLAPTQLERDAVFIYDQAERLVKHLAKAVSTGNFRARLAREYLSAIEKAINQGVELTTFKRWVDQCAGPAGADDSRTQISASLARIGAKACASVCDRAVDALRQSGALEKKSQVERGIDALNEWLSESQNVPVALPSGDEKKSEYFIRRIEAPRDGNASVAWAHPDLSVHWTQRVHTLLWVHAESAFGDRKKYVATIHWRPRGLWSQPASIGAVGAITALSLVAGFEAFGNRPTVVCRGGAGLGTGIQPAAAAVLRGPRGAFCKVLESGRSVLFVPRSETLCRQTLAHVLYTESRAMRTFSDYILRSVPESAGAPDELHSLRKTLYRACRRHGSMSNGNVQSAQRTLAESAAVWLATHAGSDAVSREPAWPSMVIRTPGGELELPLYMESIAGRGHERFAWNEMIVSAMDPYAVQAHLLPAIRFYRQTCITHRKEMCAAFALSFMCAGGSTASARGRRATNKSAFFGECIQEAKRAARTLFEVEWQPLVSRAREHLRGNGNPGTRDAPASEASSSTDPSSDAKSPVHLALGDHRDIQARGADALHQHVFGIQDIQNASNATEYACKRIARLCVLPLDRKRKLRTRRVRTVGRARKRSRKRRSK